MRGPVRESGCIHTTGSSKLNVCLASAAHKATSTSYFCLSFAPPSLSLSHTHSLSPSLCLILSLSFSVSFSLSLILSLKHTNEQRTGMHLEEPSAKERSPAKGEKSLIQGGKSPVQATVTAQEADAMLVQVCIRLCVCVCVCVPVCLCARHY